MKKIILSVVLAGAGFTAMAQVRGGDNYYSLKYQVDLNVPVGLAVQSPTYKFDANYNNVALSDIGKLKMSAGVSYGVDAEFGIFFGKKRHFGLGTGITYLMYSSDLTLEKFRVDYQATDKRNDVYRQILSSANGGEIKEKLKTSSINIPVVLKYKKRFTTKYAFTCDLGILYNLSVKTDWSTDAKFNYEAAYKWNEGHSATVYDNGATLSDKDYVATYDMYMKHNTIGTVDGVFDSLRNKGLNVVLGAKPTKTSGSVNYTTGSVGFVFRPAINIRATKRLHYTVGAYVAYQSFKNNTVSDYRLADEMGTKYSTMLNTVSTVNTMNFSINLGLRYFIGVPKDSDYDGKYDE